VLANISSTGTMGVVALITDKITSATSSGLILENNAGGDVLHVGNGGGVNATAYGGWNFDGATANTIASFGASKTLTSLNTATYPSLTELAFVKGVSSAIQTQLDAKQGTITLTTTGSSGAATLIGDTLNIPQYSGGGSQEVYIQDTKPTVSGPTIWVETGLGRGGNKFRLWALDV